MFCSVQGFYCPSNCLASSVKSKDMLQGKLKTRQAMPRARLRYVHSVLVFLGELLGVVYHFDK